MKRGKLFATINNKERKDGPFSSFHRSSFRNVKCVQNIVDNGQKSSNPVILI
jgi:hypothetical protein